MTTGWVIYNGSFEGNKFRDQAELVARAGERRDVEMHIVRHDDIIVDVNRPLHDPPHFVILLDKNVLLGRWLVMQGIAVFNDPEVIERCDNKAHQALALAAHDIPMPETIIAPKLYEGIPWSNPQYVDRIIQTLQLPLIVKRGRGSFGMHVYLVRTRQQLIEQMQALHGHDYIFQQYVQSSHGRDIRVNIIGEDVVAAMGRQSCDDFRANVTNGGTPFPITLTESQRAVALAAARAVGATFAGVDLLYGEDGEPLVCEVNAAAHIRNIYEVTRINVADAMIDYVLEAIQ